MAYRQVTFIDTDENPLVVRLKEDRIQLVAVDSEPELEGTELKAFATALFASYVGGPLARRLDGSRAKIDHVRDQLVAMGAAEELVAALDGSLRVLADLADAMTAATKVGTPVEEPASPAPAAPDYRVSVALAKIKRRPRLGETNELRWGSRRIGESEQRPALDW